MRGVWILRLGVAVIMIAAPIAAQSAPDYKWCAHPRVAEPLLIEGVTPGTSRTERATYQRDILGMPLMSREAIVVINDEGICTAAAKAYWNVLRESVATIFLDHPDTPVLVVRVGAFYMVDDLRQRDTNWEVMIFDERWKRLYGYGGGA